MSSTVPANSDPAELDWDIAFTRLSRQVGPHVASCISELKVLLRACGLRCETQTRQSPRGLSCFLAVVGRRGLLFLVDFTLLDGMVLRQCAGAALDVRLLDATGDVVDHCSPARTAASGGFSASIARVVDAAACGLSATALFVTAMGHFDVVSRHRAARR